MRKHYPAKSNVALAAATLVASVFGTQALSQTVTVKDGSGTPITTGVRWTLEEDRTFDVVPGLTGTPQAARPADTLSLQFHRSYMPVLKSGESAGATIDLSGAGLDPDKRYFLSVLPKADAAGNGLYSMAGVPVRPVNRVFPGTLTAVVDKLPLKTAQISVLLYHDRSPINGQADAIGQQEYGLCGFEAHLVDAGGTYGASGGRISTDIYGNPLGTEYPGGDLNNPVIGKMILKTDSNGVLRIRNLPPAKLTIFPFPPQVKPSKADCPGYYPGPNGEPPLTPWPESGQWMQTSTIEGTQGDDTWVKANEPAYFKEFGPPGHHVAQGFAAVASDAAMLSGSGTVTGRVVGIHMSRPPNFAFYNGPVVTECRIGLNESNSLAVGGGTAVWAGPCNSDGTFSINGTKPNTRYQLAVWDGPLDMVKATYDFVTDAAGAVDLHDVPVFGWFGRLEGKVCQDPTESGFCGDASTGISGQALNIRFRDGSIYQTVATNDEGQYEFPEVFPFFNWMVAEVDFTRFKATGVTAVADHGGPIPADSGWSMPSNDRTVPQPQYEADGITPATNVNTGNNLARTETGPALLQGIQTFLGQTNRLDWGKKPYASGENGGIAGIVHYASTRAESDPRFAVAENNEPGIPGVTVQLFLADPANPRKTSTTQANPVAEVTTDSWDASNPTGCQGDKFVINGITTDCYDGLRNFNQMRNAVFDGGYAFVNYEPGGIGTGNATPLPAGNYIVKVVAPTGYEIQKEEDKNVDFGDYYGVSSLALPPECVGVRPYPVPTELTLFPGVAIPDPYLDKPGKPRPYCDMKAVTLGDQQNAAADFNLFTAAPVAGHIVGMILDDTANEFDPHAPAFGEKYAPPFMPVSLRDMAGREFSRVYSDRYGTYNALVPSTFTFNVPMPSGVSPNMIQACLNSPFSVDPVTGRKTLDPHFNKSYTQFCYNLQYLPGKTTYLDTPVLPIAAFAGPQQYSLDCEQQAGTPAIRSVSNLANQGPWVAAGGQTLRVTSMGVTQVLNPAYNNEQPGNGVAKLIPRDFGFGAATGSVTIGGVAAAVSNWSADSIDIVVPVGSTGGQLLVTRGDGGTTARGVTVHVGGSAPTVVSEGQSIQAAINAAAPGSLVTVAPGIYEEPVIIDKRVRLQGFGAGGTLINPVTQPTEKLQAWRASICDRVAAVTADNAVSPFLLPGQAWTTRQACLDGNVVDNAPLLFGDEEAPGFFVMDRSDSDKALALQIDGFTVAGADIGGGINVNGYAEKLQISNNLITGNQGIRAGGIRIGNPDLVAAIDLGTPLPVSSKNFDVSIHHNEITQNGDTAGEVGGGGGGIGLYYGSDRYNVSSNFVCGNYSAGNGGGISHLGVSHDGVIANNKILWNVAFYQGGSVQGGGIAVMGEQSLNAAAGGTLGLSTGTGNVTIVSNTLQGNMAGAGDGGAIHISGANGNEIGSREPYRVDIFNNVIVNNVAAVSGGGIALVDSPNVRIVNNTLAHNDSVAVAARTFNTSLIQGLANGLSTSTPQPGAGIASYLNSPALAARIGGGVVAAGRSTSLSAQFSNAEVANNLVAENRRFHFGFDFVNNDPTSPVCQVNSGTNACYGLIPSAALAGVANDVAVVGDAGGLLAQWQAAWTTNNVAGGQAFAAQYYNGPRDAIVLQPESTTGGLMAVAAAFDEGGNFIDLRYGPLTPLTVSGLPFGDYRLTAISGASASGMNLSALSPWLQLDRAGQPRPAGGSWTTGAFQNAAPAVTTLGATAPAQKSSLLAKKPTAPR